MATFRTEIKSIESSFTLDYDDVLLSFGSCFSQNIGAQLSQRKFNLLFNPFGVLYNPSSIKQSIERLFGNSAYPEDQIIEHNGLWQSFDFHSSFSAVSQFECLNNIKASLSKALVQFQNATTLIVTFGTAYVYRNKANGQVVANCHKFPAANFTRERLSIAQIIDDYTELIQHLQTQFPSLKIIFTLSPIRHLKDGFEANQISKSILRIAIDEICKSSPNLHYFPSYELLLDDLRDYRFYQADLVHPNDLAIQYIWEKFQATYFNEETMDILKRVEELIKAANHRPFHASSAPHQLFKEKSLAQVLTLQTEYPGMNWDREIELFDN